MTLRPTLYHLALLLAIAAGVSIALLWWHGAAASSSGTDPRLVTGLTGSSQSGTPQPQAGSRSPGTPPPVAVTPLSPPAKSEHVRPGGVPLSNLASGSQPHVGGKATWYRDGAGLYGAAGPVLREALGDWRGAVVTVRSGNREVVVVVRDHCACGDRGGEPTVIDLSAEAFARLAPLSRGVVDVEVEPGGTIRLPDTSTEDPE